MMLPLMATVNKKMKKNYSVLEKKEPDTHVIQVFLCMLQLTRKRNQIIFDVLSLDNLMKCFR